MDLFLSKQYSFTLGKNSYQDSHYQMIPFYFLKQWF